MPPTELSLNFDSSKDKYISLVFDKHCGTYFVLQLINVSWINMNIYTIKACEENSENIHTVRDLILAKMVRWIHHLPPQKIGNSQPHDSKKY